MLFLLDVSMKIKYSRMSGERHLSRALFSKGALAKDRVCSAAHVFALTRLI